MTKKHATYYTDETTRKSLIEIGVQHGAKPDRAASLGLRVAANNHRRLVEALGRLLRDCDNLEYESVRVALSASDAEDLLLDIEKGEGK